jgi:uncharacterized membrane protein YkvA (DUF1232 family)
MMKKFQLLLRLIRDPRVKPFHKLIPILSLVYLLLPDLLPGPFDDAVVIALLVEIFLTLIPQDIVEDNRERVDQEIQQKREQDIIEGEFWEE